MKLSKLLIYVVPTFILLYYHWSKWQATFLWFTHFSVICSLLVISWTLGYYLYERSNSEKVSPRGKVVLITGCDTGFGHQLAVKLDHIGFDVFAGVLFPDGKDAQSLQKKCSPTLRVIRMDVTKQDEVEHALKEIRKCGKPLWAVVNNAGIGSGTFWDWGNDVDEFKKLFDVNVFGMIRVTKNCVPLLRESKGRVVNVASLAGRLSSSLLSHYSMAKHSVRVFSDSIRRDFNMNNDQIQVITIEPTFYKTDIINQQAIDRNRERIYSQTPESILKAYDMDAVKKIYAKKLKFINKLARSNLNEVVDALSNSIVFKHPKLYYRCAGYLDVIIWALSHAPEVLLDSVLNLQK